MSANHPFKRSFKTRPEVKRQSTLDDEERVLPPQNRDHVMSPDDVKPRSRDALNLYESIQKLRLTEIDPLFP